MVIILGNLFQFVCFISNGLIPIVAWIMREAGVWSDARSIKLDIFVCR